MQHTPLNPPLKRTRTNLYLADDIVDALDAEAARRRLSRSRLVEVLAVEHCPKAPERAA